MNEPTLLPCPFCGCDDIREDFGYQESNGERDIQDTAIECGTCSAKACFELDSRFPAHCDDWSMSWVRKRWNERDSAPRWQPIASAPHGEWLLIADAFGHSWQACWTVDKDGSNGHWSTMDAMRLYQPTHWMPLPEKP